MKNNFLVVLMIFLTGCSQNLSTTGGKIYKGYHETSSVGNGGYVELFALQNNGLWGKALKEGTSSLDGHEIYWNNKLVGRVHIPSWPLEMRNVAIANNFSVVLVPMPSGTQEIKVKLGEDEIPLTVDIEQGKITLVRLESIPVSHRKTSAPTKYVPGKIEYTFEKTKAVISSVRIPCPSAPRKLDLDSKAAEALMVLLDDADWGMRWYAAKMIRTSKNNTCREKLIAVQKSERHEDVREEIANALKVLR